jgi:prepilin-type N-terminal cleavage/methylation domain-containing protein
MKTNKPRTTPPIGRSRRRRCRAGERGFTLIEMMVTLGVFMIGMLGIVTLQVTAANRSQSSGDLTLASNLASAKLDELRLLDIDGSAESPNVTTNDLVNGSEGFTQQGGDTGTPTGYFTVSWVVTGSADIRDVTITTTWQRANEAPHQVVMQTKMVR